MGSITVPILKSLSISGFALILLACGRGNEPIAEDIKNGLDAMYSCPAIVIDNVEKTNGIDNGTSYRVMYSYSILIPKGWSSPREAVDRLNGCSEHAILTLKKFSGGIVSIGNITDGQRLNINAEIDMVKSENGWIFK